MFEVLKGILKLFWYPAVFCFFLFFVVLFVKALWSFGMWDIDPLLNAFDDLSWLRWAYVVGFVFNGLRLCDEIIPY